MAKKATTLCPIFIDPSVEFSLWSSYFEGMKAYKDESDDGF
jgi:hypothetical protein